MADLVEFVAEGPGVGVVDVWHGETVVRVAEEDGGFDLGGEGGWELCGCFVDDLGALAGGGWLLVAGAGAGAGAMVKGVRGLRMGQN